VCIKGAALCEGRGDAMASNRPWFKLYPGDWLSSLDVQVMGAAGAGALINLLCHAWQDPSCSLPDDEHALAVASRLGADWAGEVGKRVRSKFRVEGGRLYNDRLLKEFDVATNEHKAQSDGGKRSGESRKLAALNRKTLAPERVAQSTFEGSLNMSDVRCQTSDSYPPTPRKRGIVVAQELIESFHGWMELYPKKVKVDTALQAWISLCDLGEITSDNLADVYAGLERYTRSEGWARENGKFIPEPKAFLLGNGQHMGRMWKDVPPESVESKATARGAVKSSAGVDPTAEWVPSWQTQGSEAGKAGGER
jgi:uncharacterized protein YdaU (DUF1376 family)